MSNNTLRKRFINVLQHCCVLLVQQCCIRLNRPLQSCRTCRGVVLIAKCFIFRNNREKRRDFDFLSSIEVLIMDQVDVFLMQNWEHVQVQLRLMIIVPGRLFPCLVRHSFKNSRWDIIICLYFQHLFQHLHLQPKDSHEVDFSRVRMWNLNGW